MKVLFLSKRCPMGRDLIERPYGRFYFLPRLLLENGHDIYVLLLNYRKEPHRAFHQDGINWFSVSIYELGLFGYIKKAIKLIKEVNPDWIIGFSDTYFGILAAFIGKKFHIKSTIDAYDNYESYIPWLKPLHRLWHKALSEATLVTAAGPQLADYIKTFRPGKPVVIVPMASDPIGFSPKNRDECRKRMQLPMDKKIIGYCGSIHRNRGIDIIFRAYEHLRSEDPETLLVLSGRKQKGITLPHGVKWLGYLPDEQIPFLLNCMNVLLVVNRSSAFGQYSYPVKLYEAMGCQVPVVATETEASRWILKNRRECLSAPDDSLQLSRKISNLLPLGRIDYGRQNTWQDSGRRFEAALVSLSTLTNN